MNLPASPQSSPLQGAPQADTFPKMSRTNRLNYIARGVEQAVRLMYEKDTDKFYELDDDTGTYVPLDEHRLKRLVTEACVSQLGQADPKEIRDTITLIKDLNRNEVGSFDRNLIYVAQGLYWDGDAAYLTAEPDRPCAFRLFSTTRESKHVVRAEVDGDTVKAIYSKTLKELDNDQSPSVRFPFIETWADGSEDVYLDLIRAVAYCFLKKKPVGSYILIGEKRNGKSTFIGLLRTIFGDNNCSSVQLSQLGDWHYTHKLSRTLLNAPDEEEDVKTESSGVFKTIADHGVITVPVMRSSQPMEVACDFMCFYPMNHMPQWSGTGASACLERSLVIPFNADLSQYDKSTSNFARATYTKETMSDLLGVALAYATHYSSHPLEFSDTMYKERGTLVNNTASGANYRSEFERYFCGFDNLTTLYDDYVLWCKTYDYVIQSKSEFKFLFRNYLSRRTSIYVPERKGNVAGYKLPNGANKNVLYADRFLREMNMDVKTLHDRGCSVVERINSYLESKKWT